MDEWHAVVMQSKLKGKYSNRMKNCFPFLSFSFALTVYTYNVYVPPQHLLVCFIRNPLNNSYGT